MDNFWANLPLLVTAIGGFYAIYKQNQRVERGLKENTNVTVQGQQVVYNKIDSAEKNLDNKVGELGENATVAVKVANQVATANVMATHKQNEALKSLSENLNGGPGGLHSLTDRMTKLEEGHKTLVQGQIDLVKSMDHFAEVLERRLV